VSDHSPPGMVHMVLAWKSQQEEITDVTASSQLLYSGCNLVSKPASHPMKDFYLNTNLEETN